MMEHVTRFKAALAAVLAAMTALWGWFGWLLLAWGACMAIDYISGTAAACKSGEWNSSESGHPHLFTDVDGRTYLFYQGNNDKGKTWYITQEEVLWKHGKPYLKSEQ